MTSSRATIALFIQPATKIRNFPEIPKTIIQAFPYRISLNGGQKEPYFIAGKLPAYYGLYSCYTMFLLPSRSEVHQVWFGSRDWRSFCASLGFGFGVRFCSPLEGHRVRDPGCSHHGHPSQGSPITSPPSTRLYHKHDIVWGRFLMNEFVIKMVLPKIHYFLEILGGQTLKIYKKKFSIIFGINSCQGVDGHFKNAFFRRRVFHQTSFVWKAMSCFGYGWVLGGDIIIITKIRHPF